MKITDKYELFTNALQSLYDSWFQNIHDTVIGSLLTPEQSTVV